jgi:YadA head domain repeat (2 copies)
MSKKIEAPVEIRNVQASANLSTEPHLTLQPPTGGSGTQPTYLYSGDSVIALVKMPDINTTGDLLAIGTGIEVAAGGSGVVIGSGVIGANAVRTVQVGGSTTVRGNEGTAIGSTAAADGPESTAVGSGSNAGDRWDATKIGGVAIGAGATATGHRTIVIGNRASNSDDNAAQIGAENVSFRLAIGNSGYGTAGQVLKVNAAGTGVEWGVEIPPAPKAGQYQLGNSNQTNKFYRGKWDAGFNYKMIYIPFIDENGDDFTAYLSGLSVGDSIPISVSGGTVVPYRINAISPATATGIEFDLGYDVSEVALLNVPVGTPVTVGGLKSPYLAADASGAPMWQNLVIPPPVRRNELTVGDVDMVPEASGARQVYAWPANKEFQVGDIFYNSDTLEVWIYYGNKDATGGAVGRNWQPITQASSPPEIHIGNAAPTGSEVLWIQTP